MKKNAYWRKREEEQLKHYISEEAEIQRIMANKYAYMLRQIEMQINDFYARYARAEKITLAEAQQRVSKMDVQAFAAKAKKYVQEKDFSPQANKELKLYNATMRINRLELLKANIGLEMIDGFNDIESTLEQGLTKRTIDEFERQEENLRRDAGILNTTVFDNAKSARSIVNASFQNATWSTRIWGNQSQLRDSLSALLTNGLIQGRNPLQLAPALRDLFGASRKAAERLMVTEMARVQTGAQMESFKRNGIDQYEFISVDKACATCMELDGKHFRVSDMAPGENAPPIHPHCRCSTAAYVDRAQMERELFEDGTVYEGIPRSWKMIEGEDAGLGVINPNYKRHLKPNATKEEAAYNRNCVNAVVAYDLRKRGWDVEARSYLECNLTKKARNAWIDVDPVFIEANIRETIEKKMKSWGRGGRAFVGLAPDADHGHAVVAEIRDNQLVLIDPQMNKVYTNIEVIDELLSGKCEFWRMDSLEISQTGINACKGR